MSRHQTSATVYFTDVLTAQAFRAFFAWVLAALMMIGAVSKIGIARRHFRAWSDLDLLDLMPLIGTVELVLVVALLPVITRKIALGLTVLYQGIWVFASYGIADGPHVFRSAALLLLAVLALVYGRPWLGGRAPVPEGGITSEGA